MENFTVSIINKFLRIKKEKIYKKMIILKVTGLISTKLANKKK